MTIQACLLHDSRGHSHILVPTSLFLPPTLCRNPPQRTQPPENESQGHGCLGPSDTTLLQDKAAFRVWVHSQKGIGKNLNKKHSTDQYPQWLILPLYDVRESSSCSYYWTALTPWSSDLQGSESDLLLPPLRPLPSSSKQKPRHSLLPA